MLHQRGHGRSLCYNPAMPRFTIGELDLYYEDYGDRQAPPLVLLPGLGGNHQSWAPVARWLKDRYRLITVDHRDAGKSQRASRPYGIADMAADAAGLIGHLELGSTAVAGFSMGGAVGQELTLAYPDLVERLVLIATYDAGDPRGTLIQEQLARLRRTLTREDYHRTMLPWVYTHREFETVISADEVIKRLSDDPLFQEAEAYERQVQAAIDFHSRDRLAQIACPTLLVFGDEDLFTPMRFARSLQAGISGSRLVVLGGAGHGLMWTRGSEVAALIDSFLR